MIWYCTSILPIYLEYRGIVVPKRQLLLDLPRFNHLTVAIALLISIFPYIAVVVALHASLQRCDQIFQYISLLIGDFEPRLQVFDSLEYVVAKAVSTVGKCD